MMPETFVAQMREQVEDKFNLTPKQVEDAKDVLDAGHHYIAKTLSEKFDDMSLEASDMAYKMQALLIVFVEHCINTELLKAFDHGC